MKRFLIFLIYSFTILIIAALDAAFFPSLGGSWILMNVSLALGIFVVVILNRRIALTIYISSTILIGLSSAQMLLFPLILGAGILLLIDWLVETVFTNRSYYTVVTVGIAGWMLYYLLYALLITGLGLFSDSLIRPEISFHWISSVIFNAILLYLFFSLAYLLTHNMSKRFKSYFIVSEQ